MSSDVFHLKLNKFDVSSIDPSCKIVVIGKPGTGKSTLIEDILFHVRRKFPMGIAMVGTVEGVQQYQRLMPDSFIYDEYNQEVINNLLARQRKAVRNQWKNPYAFLVLDDCMYENKWVRAKSTRNIFMNGRHYKLLVIIALQYCMDIPPSLRTCVDYVFMLRENIPRNRERLFNYYCGIFDKRAIFERVFSACTENHECLVIKNRSVSNKLDEVVFWYKADLHKPFRLCSRRIWKYHEQNYNNHYESDEDDDSGSYGRPLQSLSKKRHSKYVIEKYDS